MCDLLNLSLIDNELPFQSFVKTFPLVYGMFIRESERERYRKRIDEKLASKRDSSLYSYWIK
jgi:hypothetical protein